MMKKSPLPSAFDALALGADLGLTRYELGRALRLTPTEAARLSSGVGNLPSHVSEAFKNLLDFNEMLDTYFDKEPTGKFKRGWVRHPSSFIDNNDKTLSVAQIFSREGVHDINFFCPPRNLHSCHIQKQAVLGEYGRINALLKFLRN